MAAGQPLAHLHSLPGVLACPMVHGLLEPGLPLPEAASWLQGSRWPSCTACQGTLPSRWCTAALPQLLARWAPPPAHWIYQQVGPLPHVIVLPSSQAFPWLRSPALHQLTLFPSASCSADVFLQAPWTCQGGWGARWLSLHSCCILGRVYLVTPAHSVDPTGPVSRQRARPAA